MANQFSLTASLGSWSARHRPAAAGWLLLVVVVVAADGIPPARAS